MSTTEILLFAILIAIIMVFFSILVFGLDNQYWEYRKRWEKIKKDQIDDVKSLEKKLLKSSKEGWVYLIKIFFNVFIASSVVAIAIYYLIKFLNS